MPLFKNNSSRMINAKTGEVLEPDTRIVGLREGIHPGMGQSAASNPMLGCSVFEKDDMFDAPLYIMKRSAFQLLKLPIMLQKSVERVMVSAEGSYTIM